MNALIFVANGQDGQCLKDVLTAEGAATALQDKAARKLLIEKGLERARQFTWGATAGRRTP